AAAAERGVRTLHGGTSCRGVMAGGRMLADADAGLGLFALWDSEGAYGTGIADPGDDPVAAGSRAAQDALAGHHAPAGGAAVERAHPTLRGSSPNDIRVVQNATMHGHEVWRSGAMRRNAIEEHGERPTGVRISHRLDANLQGRLHAPLPHSPNAVTLGTMAGQRGGRVSGLALPLLRIAVLPPL
ncbi:MAG: hypothetical protein AAF074_10770, partial [Pseudomonadota bacterium]